MYEIDVATCNESSLDTLLSVGTYLNFCYIHDSFFPFLFLFLLIAGGIIRQHMSVSNIYVIFLELRNATQILQWK
jgi:hypothetical protein